MDRPGHPGAPAVDHASRIGVSGLRRPSDGGPESRCLRPRTSRTLPSERGRLHLAGERPADDRVSVRHRLTTDAAGPCRSSGERPEHVRATEDSMTTVRHAAIGSPPDHVGAGRDRHHDADGVGDGRAQDGQQVVDDDHARPRQASTEGALECARLLGPIDPGPGHEHQCRRGCGGLARDTFRPRPCWVASSLRRCRVAWLAVRPPSPNRLACECGDPVGCLGEALPLGVRTASFCPSHA